MTLFVPAHMIKRLSFMVCAIWMGLVSGCHKKPSVVPVGSLSFPVVLIVGTSATSEIPSHAEVVADQADLSLMPVNRYSPLTDTTNSDPPFVIDGDGKICEMRNLKGQHGGAWMMLHPTGQMPISFTLIQRQESGVEAARTLIIGCKYLGRDLDQERKDLRCERISKATTMTEIMQIIDETADPPND